MEDGRAVSHMKKNVSQQYKPFLVSRTALYGALLTGVLGFLMHPFVVFGYRFPDLGFITWFFLVPLFLGIHRHKFWHKFVLCFAAGTIMGYGKFYWLITAMQKFGGLNFFESFGALTFMCLFLGLLFGFFLALSSWTNHMTKIPLLFIVPLFMTSHDVLLHYFPFNGFPWGLPPYALGEWLAFFQWVDHTGLFGLSLFIYLINGLIAGSFLLFIHRRQLDKAIARFVVMVVLVVLSLFASSLASQQYEKNKTTVKHINLGLVQGNIPQDKKWDPYFAQDILNNYFALTHKAIKDGAQLVIWPETAYPFNLQYPNLFQEQFLNKEKLMTPLLIGAFVTERGDDALHWYNSVVQVNTDASMPRIYRKMHLVPFGEYLPLRRLLSFVPTITRAVGELTAGHQFDMFTFDDLSIGS
ncbi:MAG TPA: apolipoprotein N-acyltransferase, partial [bacterium]|nr:apolipoprotein N-acyltransferase [bacterium]